MSDLIAHINQLEIDFAESFEAHGDGGNLVFILFSLDARVVEMGPVTIERGSVPREYLPGTTWNEPYGRLVLTDHSGAHHSLLALAGGTESSVEPLQAFLRLARRAGAACFRLPRGMAATGASNAPELNWLGTMYSYLKGTPFVVEGPGFSRIQSAFAASVEVLSLIHRGDADGNTPSYPGSLRPGIPGIEGEARFEFAPLGSVVTPPPSGTGAEPAPTNPAAEPARLAEPPGTPTPTTLSGGGRSLKPDEFEFETGGVVGGFTSKQLQLLDFVRQAGPGGASRAAVCGELGYKDDLRGWKAVCQLVSRTQGKIDGTAPYIIELVNGRYCLTCTSTRS